MAADVRFLVVDDNADSRMLLARTLMRRFPEAVVLECQHGDTAVRIAEREQLNAVIAHRTFDYDGETLIALMRRVNPAVPIVMVSGYDRSARALAAGANAFLNYDGWLNIGTVVADVMESAQKTSPNAALETTP